MNCDNNVTTMNGASANNRNGATGHSKKNGLRILFAGVVTARIPLNCIVVMPHACALSHIMAGARLLSR